MELTEAANGALFEIVYFHQAGREASTFYVSLEQGLLQVNQETEDSRVERSIPLPAIESLAWGRENVLFINWREGEQFRQTTAMGSPVELARLVAELKTKIGTLAVDEGSRHLKERKLYRTLFLVLLIGVGLPVGAFFLAVHLGYAASPY